jgi:fucose permease
VGIAVGNGLLAATLGSWEGIVAGGLVLGAGLGISSVAANQIGTPVARRVRAARRGS